MRDAPRTIQLRGLLHICLTLCWLVSLFVCTSIVPSSQIIMSSALVLFSAVAEFFRWRHPPKIFVSLFSVGIVLFAAMSMRLDTIVDVFTGAAFLMAGVKMVDDKRPRDCIQILLLLTMTLIAAAFLGTSEVFIYHCFSFAFLSGLSLLLTTWYTRQPDARFSAAVVRQLLARALAMWVLMLPLCILLFFAAPRADLSMLPRRGADPQSSVGFSDVLTLGTVRQIQESDELAFRAEMDRLPPQMLYWRGLVLDTPRGASWYPSRRGMNRRSNPSRNDSVGMRQKITMEPMRYNIIFTLDVPLFVDGGEIFPIGDGMFQRRNFRGSQRVEYEAVSQPSSVFRASRPLRNPEFYLLLDDNDTSRLRRLVEEITHGLDNTGKIAAIMKYLSPPAFSYSLDDLPVARNALEVFVLSEKRGNCEYFAVAMTVMLRMAGIPARMVAGYQGGVYNQSGGYYIVDQANAHVWVEVWDDGETCWRRFDPTPVVRGTAADAIARRYSKLELYFDVINYRLSSFFFGYDREAQSELVAGLRTALSNPQNYIQNNEREFISAGKTLIIALLSVGTLAVVIALLRTALRRGCRTREDVLLQVFLRTMRRRGYSKLPSEGLEEFARRVRAESTESKTSDSALVDIVDEFVVRFERHYFGGVPLDDATFAELKDAIRKMRG